MTDHMDLSPLFNDVESGALVLTPNYRSSVRLHEIYGLWRRSNALPEVYPSPNIQPVDIWVRNCHEELNYSGVTGQNEILLDSINENLVWRNIISRSSLGSALLNSAATALAVGEAFTLAHLWQIPEKELRSFLSFPEHQDFDDLSAFLSWSRDFETFCKKQHLVSQVQLLGDFISLVEEGKVNLPDTIRLAGFTNPPPLYARLLDALKQRCPEVSPYEFPREEPDISIKALPMPVDELVGAARWSNDILQTRPAASIGIISPGIATNRSEIERVFSRIFCSEETTNLARKANRPFSISGGVPAGQVPLLMTALGILELNMPKADTLEFCRLLRSPFISGADTEEHHRACLEKHLRKRNELQVQNSGIRYFANNSEKEYYCPLLAEALLQFDELRRHAGRKPSTTDEWSELFEQQLAALGWPGERYPDTSEHKHMETWQQVLVRYKSLGGIFGKVSLDSALAILRQVVDETTVAQTEPDAPVQVMTPVEAEGQVFTHLWMMGMTEQRWPPPPRVTPFLPYSLQKKFRIPQANIDTWSNACRDTLQQFVSNTNTAVVFSLPKQEEDISCKPAAMLNMFGKQLIDEGSVSEFMDLHPATMDQFESTAMEQLEDELFLPPAEQEMLSGGSSLLADQAECPFRSFAVNRLHCDRLEDFTPGLNARDAGSLLHLALQNFWTVLQSQENLSACNEKELEEKVSAAVHDAVVSMGRFHPETMTPGFCAIEEQRLNALVVQWLEEERKRGSFRVIASEHRATWEHAGLVLKLRIDRLDETTDGHLVLVDYKSSKSFGVKWQEERQSNPQLMLYLDAVSRQNPDQPVDGVFFAQVNIEDTRYRGLSNSNDIYPGSLVEEQRDIEQDTSWAQLKTQWEQSLGMLADEFLSGYLAVQPKQNNTCNFCHLHGFCRIQEMES